MAKNKPAKQPPTQSGASGPWPFSYWLRLALSAWLFWHVSVVFLAPLSLQPKSSLLAEMIAQSPFVRWYTDPLYLNGGYAFFSPDPPRSGFLMRYKVFGEGQEPIAEGEFPNRSNPNYATQWPRLWYHRHMMLVDQSSDVPVYFPENDTPEAFLSASRRNQELSMRSFARHMLRKHEGATAVSIELLEHSILMPQQAMEGIDPTDASLYRTVLTVVERADQLEQPLLPTPTGQSGPEPLPLGRAG